MELSQCSVWVLLSVYYLTAGFELSRFETLCRIDLDQTVGMHKNNLERSVKYSVRTAQETHPVFARS